MKVTGIGGVFFRAKDLEALATWYKKYLGVFAMDSATKTNRLYAFHADTDYFDRDRNS